MISRIEISAKLESAADSIFLAREALESGTVGTQTVYSSLYIVEETLRNLSIKIGDTDGIEE